jgi:hypothetical protein
MRNAHTFPMLLVIGVLLVPSAFASADPPTVVGRLNLATGPVSFLPGGTDQWAPGITNYPMSAGDRLWVDEGGRAEIHVGSTALRLDAGTEMSILNLDEQTVQLGLSQGSFNIRLRYLEQNDIYEIDTPNSVVTIMQAGSYRIDATPGGEVSLTVREGSAEVAAANDVFVIRAGETAYISGTDRVSYFVQRASTMDSWDKWSAARDVREDQLISARYAPREMIGVEDLDDNGVWSNVSGYGPVWSPKGVPAGWAPYRFGRWAWVTPWGWTWIDNAPWGFAPFHYGRWASIQSRWVWIPGTIVARPVYAPALVVFVGGSAPDNIGWFPLGPREVYVPPYQASTAYVQRMNVTNVTNITVQIIEQTNVARVTYVNRNVTSAVTAQPRQSFIQSRPTSDSVITRDADTRRLTVLSMAASLQPVRESIVGQTVNPQHPTARPPAAVSTRQVFSRTAPAPARQSFVGNSPAARVSAPVAAPQAQTRVVVLAPSNRVQNPPTTREAAKQQLSSSVQPAPTSRPVPSGSAAAVKNNADAEAQTLLATLNARSFPDAEKHLEAARATKGIKLDYASLNKRLTDLRKSFALAQQNQKAGKTDVALKQGQDIQKQIADVEKVIADAMKAAGETDSGRPSPQDTGRSSQPKPRN